MVCEVTVLQARKDCAAADWELEIKTLSDLHRCIFFYCGQRHPPLYFLWAGRHSGVQLLCPHSQLHSTHLLWGIMEPHASRPAAQENKLSCQNPNQEWHEWSTYSSCNGNNAILHCAQLPVNSTKQNGNIPSVNDYLINQDRQHWLPLWLWGCCGARATWIKLVTSRGCRSLPKSTFRNCKSRF